MESASAENSPEKRTRRKGGTNADNNRERHAPLPSEHLEEGARAILLEVSGMSCAACSGKIEKHISNLSGVISAEVSLSTGRLRAIVGRLSPESQEATIVREVESLGYGARSVSGAARDPDALRRAHAERSESGRGSFSFRSLLLCLWSSCMACSLTCQGRSAPSFMRTFCRE